MLTFYHLLGILVMLIAILGFIGFVVDEVIYAWGSHRFDEDTRGF